MILKFILTPLLAATASIGLSIEVSANAGGDKALDVIGLRYGDPISHVDATLSKEGFSPSYYTAAIPCDRSYTFEMAVVAQSKLRSPDYHVSCGIGMEDRAGRKIVARFLMFPSGYQLTSVEYAFPFSGNFESLQKVLISKYGAPTKVTRDSALYTGKDDIALRASIGIVNNAVITLKKPGQISINESKSFIQTEVMKIKGSEQIKL